MVFDDNEGPSYIAICHIVEDKKIGIHLQWSGGTRQPDTNSGTTDCERLKNSRIFLSLGKTIFCLAQWLPRFCERYLSEAKAFIRHLGWIFVITNFKTKIV